MRTTLLRNKVPEPDPALKRSLIHTIKACVRNGAPLTDTQRSILKVMLDDVYRYGRLAAPIHRLLMVFCKKCGVTP